MTKQTDMPESDVTGLEKNTPEAGASSEYTLKEIYKIAFLAAEDVISSLESKETESL